MVAAIGAIVRTQQLASDVRGSQYRTNITISEKKLTFLNPQTTKTSRISAG